MTPSERDPLVDFVPAATPRGMPRAERLAAGSALRKRVSLAELGKLPTFDDRSPLDLLKTSNHGRIRELIPIRHGRMSASPLAFFRGSVIIMAHDLARTPTSGIMLPICGDCHLQNFGWFATPERNLIFDVNDFDEAILGPWEWDVKRVATSVAIVARQRDLKRAEQARLAEGFARAYQRRLEEFSQLSAIELWSWRLDTARLHETSHYRELVAEIARRAQKRTVDSLMGKLTHRDGDTLQFTDDLPLIFHAPDRAKYLHKTQALLQRYRHTLALDRRALLDRFRLLDVAYKVVGVGSVGLRCAIALLVDDDEHPLILQLKEARPSVWAGALRHSTGGDQGERIVLGQRLMQAASDAFLGWGSDDAGMNFYVRQLRDMKTTVDLDEMNAAEFESYVHLCGWALARAHAKSGRGAELLGYLDDGDRFERSIAEFAVSYADQNERDFATFINAIEQGHIATQSGDESE